MSTRTRITRRTFLKSAAAASAAATLARRRIFAATPSDPRPNILFCLADDWGWPHAGALGDKTVRTPAFDRVAREGALFTHAYCASPSCTPSRASILTGQMFYRLEQSANLWSTLDKKFTVYPGLLESAGYTIGLTRKGWGPGDFKAGGWARNPAGPSFPNFAAFFDKAPKGKPFCFWFGTNDPHRGYDKGSGLAAGLKPESVSIPPFLPDSPEVREDIINYYAEIERANRDIAAMLAILEKAGKLENTLIVITGDNGWPFPRGKTNLYDYGVRQPFAVRWPAAVKAGLVIDDMISLSDLAPTFLAAAGLKPTPEMTARSFLDVLTAGKSGRVDPARDRVIVGRERHVGRNCRPGNVGYPMRAISTHRYKYIRNFFPDRWPTADPPEYADCDGGPTKTYMLKNADDAKVKPLWDLSFGKRPLEELCDLEADPNEMKNLLVDKPESSDARRELERLRQELWNSLSQYLRATADPRVVGGAERFDEYPYRG